MDCLFFSGRKDRLLFFKEGLCFGEFQAAKESAQYFLRINFLKNSLYLKSNVCKIG